MSSVFRSLLVVSLLLGSQLTLPAQADDADDAGCELVADRVYEACQTLGMDEDTCLQLREVALESCEETFPIPPVLGPCENFCETGARQIYEDCLAGGGLAEECSRDSAGFLAHCLEGCEGQPPPPLDCHDGCMRQLDAMLAQCHSGDPDAAGVILDEAECLAQAHQMFEHCLMRCDGQPPPPQDCVEGCHRQLDEMLMRCQAGDANTGGGAQQIDGECEAQAHQAFEACLQRCEGQPPPPPPPADCHDGCMRQLEAMLVQCDSGDLDAAGVILDDAECVAQAHQVFDHCLLRCDGQPPPPPPQDCHEGCHRQFEAMLEACHSGDPTVAGENLPDGECEARAHQMLENCMQRCDGQPPPPPPPPDCHEGCHRQLDEMLMRCQAGEPDETGEILPDGECEARAHQAFENCLMRCNGQPPPADCHEGCHREFEAMLMRCHSGDPTVAGENLPDAECEAQAHQMLENCMQRCDGQPPPPPPPPQECPERCHRQLAEMLMLCQEDANGDGLVDDVDADCEAQAHQAFEDCLAGCDGQSPPPVDCEPRCEAAASLLYRECAANGGNERECRRLMTEQLDGCLARCTEDEPPPPPADCAGDCEQQGAQLVFACLEQQGDADECEGMARVFVDECLARCDHGLPPSCGDRCAHEARRMLAACIESGGDPQACRQRADHLLEACLMTCDRLPPFDCNQGCGERAKETLLACGEEGLSDAECRQRTNDFLERCLAACEPIDPPEPPACGERCNQSMDLLVSECMARGGSERECLASAEEYLARCQQDCEDRPEPDPDPCDQPCEEIADLVLQRCLDAADADQDCQAIVDDFLTRCSDAAQGNCERSLLADQAAPVPFLRGDFNRDRDLDISDTLAVLNFLFLGGRPTPCEDAADSNDDGEINITDGVAIVNHLFLGTGDLPEPSHHEGHDPTSDNLICAP